MPYKVSFMGKHFALAGKEMSRGDRVPTARFQLGILFIQLLEEFLVSLILKVLSAGVAYCFQMSESNWILIEPDD